MDREKKIIEFAKKKPHTLKEIMTHFDIPVSKKRTLTRRLSENDVILRENRGRKKLVL